MLTIAIMEKVMENLALNQKIAITWISIKLICWILLHQLANLREGELDIYRINYFFVFWSYTWLNNGDGILS
jgi:hypothetical protein